MFLGKKIQRIARPHLFWCGNTQNYFFPDDGGLIVSVHLLRKS